MNPLLRRLRRHPFPVAAHFRRAVALSFAFPVETLRLVVSDGLEIDAHEGFGFVTLAMVWTEGLRPAALPGMLGQDFFLAGYRIFTRLTDHGRRLRGLQVLRSETDQRRMVRMGNLLTHYHYRQIALEVTERDLQTRVITRAADGSTTADVSFSPAEESAALPPGSPFADWKAARRFAGPMPFTFSAESDRKFVVIEGVRSHWVPRPVTVSAWKVGLFDEAPYRGVQPILANAFEVCDVPYRWKRGRIVQRAGEP